MVDVTVQGWEQKGGALWPLNAEVMIDAPFLGVSGAMLISEVTYSLSDAGTTTDLTLRPTGSFAPQPEIPENETVLEGLED
jgi:prophage tail gpP-like protein